MTAIKAFRSGIRFSERLFKNLKIQSKWFFNLEAKSSKNIHTWCISNRYHMGIAFGLDVIIIIVLLLLLFPILILWAFLKSI